MVVSERSHEWCPGNIANRYSGLWSTQRAFSGRRKLNPLKKSGVLKESIRDTVEALRQRDMKAVDLVHAAVAHHDTLKAQLNAYRTFDATSAIEQAKAADDVLDRAAFNPNIIPAPLCGIPISIKDIYGTSGLPTFAGSNRQLPDEPWSRDAWLVARARRAGAVVMGKTHTVEFAYGGVGLNPHSSTPRNPWDQKVNRIPGGSSCGAGVSLWEGSALVALGSDTGGSIRIPASMTGVVGHKTTKGRWSTQGVVQLSNTFDTVGALTRTVEDSAWFFGSVDPFCGDPCSLLKKLTETSLDGVRIGLPECSIWEACQDDLLDVLRAALTELEAAGAQVQRDRGSLLDDAVDLYLTCGIGKAELSAFLNTHLPEWTEELHPIVGTRLEGHHQLDGPEHHEALLRQRSISAKASELFTDKDVLVLPGHLVTPPPIQEVASDLEVYGHLNYTTLRATCAINLLDLCAISVPVGLDSAGMPVGLQLIAQGGDDEKLLGIALALERSLGTAKVRLGSPPLIL